MVRGFNAAGIEVILASSYNHRPTANQLVPSVVQGPRQRLGLRLRNPRYYTDSPAGNTQRSHAHVAAVGEGTRCRYWARRDARRRLRFDLALGGWGGGVCSRRELHSVISPRRVLRL